MDLETDTRGNYNPVQAKASLKLVQVIARAALIFTLPIGIIVTLLHSGTDSDVRAFVTGLALVVLAGASLISMQISRTALILFRHQAAESEAHHQARDVHMEEIRASVEDIAKALARILDYAEDQLDQRRRRTL